MARRGRPRHPDILTPRQWEVLALIRLGLTDPQIAERLGISLDGAKYHASEILARLGVSTREEAAAWQQEPKWPLAWLGPAWKLFLGGSAAASLAALVALAILIARGASESSEDVSAVATQTTPAAELASYPQRPASRIQLVYMVPTNTTADANYFLRTAGSSGPDQPLGNYTPAGPLTNNSPYVDGSSYLWASSQSSGATIIDLATGHSRTSDDQLNTISAILLARDSMVYEVNGVSGDSIVGQDAEGNVVARYTLPEVPYTPSYRPTGARGSIGLAPTVTIVSLLEAESGHIIALAVNGGNSALVDLDDNRRLDLTGYRAFTASLAADGSVYALFNTNDVDSELNVAHIDEDTMTLDWIRPVGIGIGAGVSLDSINLVSTQSGPVFLYIMKDTGGQQPNLFRFDPDTSVLERISVDGNPGLNVTVGIDGNLYFYGGLAGPSVSTYDVASDSFTGEVARAPNGTYVQAVFIR